MNRSSISQRARDYVASLPEDMLGTPRKYPSDGSYGDDVLPFDMYRGTRQNIERVGDQINRSYSFGIYDGCAVLMRRMLEMLLILSFKANGIEQDIKDADGDYCTLSEMVNKAVASHVLDLSRNAKEYLGPFREKCNLSAHNPFHNARCKDIEIMQPKFRHLVEELFYKAGILH